MNLAELQARGAFVSARPVERTLTWVHAAPDSLEEVTDTFVVKIKRHSFGVLSDLIESGSGNRSRSALLIASSIILGTDEAPETLTYDQAYLLDPSLAALFIKAINEVNRFDGKAADPKN